jgi:hypothetical protein
MKTFYGCATIDAAGMVIKLGKVIELIKKVGWSQWLLCQVGNKAVNRRRGWRLFGNRGHAMVPGINSHSISAHWRRLCIYLALAYERRFAPACLLVLRFG